jgi:hypothetical protein
MKNSSLPAILLGVFGITTIAAAVLCVMYVKNIKQIRSIQSQVAIIQYNSARIQAIVGEAVEYSKKDPSIEPILESVGFKPKAQTPAANTQQGKK